MKHVKLFEAFMGSPMKSPKSVLKTVLQIVLDSPDHKALMIGLMFANLAGTLSGKGPFTIFAPSDDAFAKLPMGELKDIVKDIVNPETRKKDISLTPENGKKLASIITNHVVAGKVMAGDLMDGQMIETLGGGKLKVAIRNGVVTINQEGNQLGNGSKVSAPDLAGTNGVVHVVDNVILP